MINHLEMLDNLFGKDETTEEEFDAIWQRRAFDPHLSTDVIQNWLNDCPCGEIHSAAAFNEFISQGCSRCAAPEGEAITRNPVQVAFVRPGQGIWAMCIECFWAWEGCHNPEHEDCPVEAENILYL